MFCDKLKYCFMILIGLIISHEAYGFVHDETEWLVRNAERKASEKERLQNAEELIGNVSSHSQDERRKEQAEKITEATQKSITETHIKEAQKLVSGVKQKEFSLKGFGLAPSLMGKIASHDGVNIGELLSRYNSRDFLEKETDKLPGLMVFISLGCLRIR